MLSTEFTKVIIQWLNMTFWGIITAEICYKGRKIKKSEIGKTTWVVTSTNIDKKETSKALLSVICIKLQKEKTTCLPWNPVNSRGYPITNPVIESSCTCPPSKSFSHIYEIAEENPQEDSYSSVIMNKDVCLTRLSNQLMFFSTVDWVQ